MNTEKLLEKILSPGNMDEAIKQVKRNKGATGVGGMLTTELAGYFEAHGEEIKELIRQRKYKPSTVLRVKIPKPSGGVSNVSLIRIYLVSGVMIDDEYKESIIGIPQGGNLSPLLLNIMLNELDWKLELRGLNFVRYADDSIILVGSEKSANRVMTSVTRYIEENLWLKVNASKSKIETPRCPKYLGYGFYFDRFQKQYKARPHEDPVMKIKDKIKELTSWRWGVSIDYRIMHLDWAIRGWLNYFRIANMKMICREIDQHMRFRLRMCIWKQWKKPRTRYKSLMKIGITKGKAWEWANSRKGYGRVAGSVIMQRAVTNDILKRKGLVSLIDYYKLVQRAGACPVILNCRNVSFSSIRICSTVL